MRMWWRRTPDRRQEIGERLVQIFLEPVWSDALRAEAQALRFELLALDDDQEERAELPVSPRRAVADPVAEARRAAEREREAEAARWRRVMAMRWGAGGLSRQIYQPERAAQRSAVRRQQREHTSSLVRDGFRPWR